MENVDHEFLSNLKRRARQELFVLSQGRDLTKFDEDIAANHAALALYADNKVYWPLYKALAAQHADSYPQEELYDAPIDEMVLAYLTKLCLPQTERLLVELFKNTARVIYDTPSRAEDLG